MCGINGFIKSHLPPEEARGLLQNMNTSIKHRWPDDEGSFVENINWKTLGFWQVRLSIIDLSPAGHQPMFYDKALWASNDAFIKHENKNLTIIFNGEIYNYQEIKEELLEKGYTFSTHSDTEVMLASYEEWGTDCVNHFNGMWAFCIFDKEKDTLFCSRDRLWKKPFYYYFDGKEFIFSSELKGILEHKELHINRKANINPEALDFYFTTGFIPAPWTIYKDIQKLESSHSLELRITDKELQIKKYRYYEIPEYRPINDKKALIEEWKKLLEDSTKIRMFRSDVPVWAFLSGWLDSSSVVAEMTKWTEKTKLHTFSIGFEGKYDETEYINIVKDAFGTNHHHKYFKEEDFENMIENIYHFYDEPFGDFSNFPTMFVSKLARENVTVSLSWDGWDEIFGWYLMHQIGAQMDFIRLIPRFIRQVLFIITPKTANNLSIVSKLKEAFRVSLLPKEQFYSEASGTSVYKPTVYKKWTEEKLSEILKKCHGNFTQALIDFDLLYNTLSDNFLVKTDRASMSQGLEIRSPLLDYRFIEYSRKIPVKWKTNIFKTKILMREIIKDIVPWAILKRGKQWFTPPIEKWILGGEYIREIESGIEMLHAEWILDENWYDFYKNKVLSENNLMFNVYKIKMFLFIKWYNIWIKKSSSSS